MISGNEIEIRHATEEEIDAIKRLFDRHKNELGFVVKSALANSIKRNELVVTVTDGGEIVGVVHYRHRKDGQTTLYSIVVAKQYRHHAVASSLVNNLQQEALAKQQHSIALKCPIELDANKFYKALGFELVGIDNGKHRPLSLWRLSLQTSPHPPQ